MWAAPAGGSGAGRSRSAGAITGMLLLLSYLMDVSSSQPTSSRQAQEALHSFCQTFSGRPSLCGSLRRYRRSPAAAPWSQLMTSRSAGMPDTKWCGKGNTASGYDDLGRAEATDRCCRDHDHCPLYLGAGESRGGATNNGRFTRSACECDKNFFTCLTQVNTVHSQLVGELYFNILMPDCIKNVTGNCSRLGGSGQEQEEQEEEEQGQEERLRLVKNPLASHFPEPSNEDEMLDEAEDLAIRAFSMIIQGR